MRTVDASNVFERWRVNCSCLRGFCAVFPAPATFKNVVPYKKISKTTALSLQNKIINKYIITTPIYKNRQIIVDYSKVWDSCCTSLNLLGLFTAMEPCPSIEVNRPLVCKYRLMYRATNVWGLVWYSFITSLGAATWSPLRRFNKVTHTMAALIPAWCVNAENGIASISMFFTPCWIKPSR